MEVHREEEDDGLFNGYYDLVASEVAGIVPDSATASVLPRAPRTLWGQPWNYHEPAYVVRAYGKAVAARKTDEERKASRTVAWQPDTLGPIYWLMRNGLVDLWHAKILHELSEFDWVALAKTCRSFAGIVRTFRGTRTIVLARERCNFFDHSKARMFLKVAVRNDDYPTFQRIVRQVDLAYRHSLDVQRGIGYGIFVPALRYAGKHKKENFLMKFLVDKEILDHLKSGHWQTTFPSKTVLNLNHRDNWYYVDIAIGAIKGGHDGLFNNCIDKFCAGSLDKMGFEARWKITNAAIKVDNFEVASRFGLRAFSWADGRIVFPSVGERRELLGGPLLVQACAQGSKRCIEGFGEEFVRLVSAWYEMDGEDTTENQKIFTRIRVYLRDAAVQLCIDNRMGMLAHLMTRVYDPLAKLPHIPSPEEFSLYLTHFIKEKGMNVNTARVEYYPNYLLSKLHYRDNQCYWWLKEYAFKHFLSRTRDAYPIFPVVPHGEYVQCKDPNSRDQRAEAYEKQKRAVRQNGAIPGRFAKVFVPKREFVPLQVSADEVVIVDPTHYTYPIFNDKTYKDLQYDSLISTPVGQGCIFLRDIDLQRPFSPGVSKFTYEKEPEEGEDRPDYVHRLEERVANQRETKRPRKE